MYPEPDPPEAVKIASAPGLTVSAAGVIASVDEVEAGVAAKFAAPEVVLEALDPHAEMKPADAKSTKDHNEVGVPIRFPIHRSSQARCQLAALKPFRSLK